MSKNQKRFGIVLLIVVIAGVAIGYFVWNKPRRTVADEKGIELTAAALVKEFQANETAANAKYLDKAMQVTGVVSEVSKNQEGKTTVMLSSDDAMTGVFCTMKDAATVTSGETVTIKGFCSGMLSDVRLRDAILVK